MKTQEHDRFVQQYIETALWSSTDDNENPLDENYDVDDLAPETLAQFITDCDKFREQHGDLIERACEDTGQDEENVAHDFWLTRNEHGAGFWDGDWDNDVGKYGEQLTSAAHEFDVVTLYVADDGLIYSL